MHFALTARARCFAESVADLSVEFMMFSCTNDLNADA